MFFMLMCILFSAGGGHFIPDGYPFILLVGSYTVEQASDLLGGFFGMVC
jgi:hypothetical protein